MSYYQPEVSRISGHQNDSWSKVEKELEDIERRGTFDFQGRIRAAYLGTLSREIEASERAKGRIAPGVDRSFIMMRQIAKYALYSSNSDLSAGAKELLQLACRVIPGQPRAMGGERTTFVNHNSKPHVGHNGNIRRLIVQQEPSIHGKVRSFVSRTGNILVTNHPAGHKSVETLGNERAKPDPAIKKQARLNGTKKKVKFSSKKQCIDRDGIVVEEPVEDNEGKTSALARKGRTERVEFLWKGDWFQSS